MWNFILGPILLQENLQKTNYQFRSVRSIKIDGVLSNRIRSKIVCLGCNWTVYARLFYLNTRPEKYFTLFWDYILFSEQIFLILFTTQMLYAISHCFVIKLFSVQILLILFTTQMLYAIYDAILKLLLFDLNHIVL